MSITELDAPEPETEAPADVGGLAAGQLRAFVERIEYMDAEIKDRQDDRKEILKEAASAGFDVKIVNHVVRLRRKEKEERQEQEELTRLYLAALGED